jgi:hypothetical protein
MKLANTQVVQTMAGALKSESPGLDPVPHDRVAAMIGAAILGAFVCLVGLGLMALGGYVIVGAKEVRVLSLALVGGGLAVFFVGSIFISRKLLASLLNVVGVGRAIWATVKGQPAPPSAQ